MRSVKSKWRAAPLALSLLGLAAAAATTQAQERKEYPQWADSAARVASAPDSQKVSIAVYLGFRNESQLRDLIADISTPGSAHYGQYLSAEEFRARFAPDPASVKLVQKELQRLGFQIDDTPKSGLFVPATGSVAQVKAAFGVSQELYSYKGKLLRSNAESPRLPAAISSLVTVVAGLDDSAVLRQTYHVGMDRPEAAAAPAALSAGAMKAASPNAPPTPFDSIPSPVCSKYFGDHTGTLEVPVPPYAATLPWVNCGYTPQQIQQAYGGNEVFQDGTGVKVGIVDVYGSPTIVADGNQYSKNHGLPPLTAKNFTQILPAGIYNVSASDPCGPQGWYVEETLDVDSVHSMAPGAKIVFAGDTCSDPANAPLYSLIDEHTVDVITNSYGYNGEDVPSWFITIETLYFQQAAAEGVTVLFSSGDDGDLIAENGIASGSWDATSPYVTAVGGTSVALYANGQKQDWGWGTYRVLLNGVTVPANGRNIQDSGPALPFTFYGGAGGGPSLVELQPSYQADVVPYSLSGYTTNAAGARVALGAAYRVTPDIAMVGDPYTGFLFGMTYTMANPPAVDRGCQKLSSTTEYCEEPEGGTSLSTPQFAGVVARVNQARLEVGKPTVGFLNPALYSLYSVGATFPGGPLVDVKAPAVPTAVLRGYWSNLNELRVVTMNSTLNGSKIVEGTDTSYRVTPGYDEVTGVGTPWIPAFILSLLFY
jgi:subtilase family serine protease